MSEDSKHVLILAGEHSSDQYGVELLEMMRLAKPQWTFSAVGGPLLKERADIFVGDSVSITTVGIVELFSNYFSIRRLFAALKRHLKSSPPDIAIIIDFAHYNFKIAKVLQKTQVPIYTFITPNFWIWGDQKKARKLVEYNRHIFTIFKPEHAFYKKLTPDVSYLGHPLSKQTLPQPMGLKIHNPPKILLLPGSRNHEISRVLPAMLKALEKYAVHKACSVTIFSAHSDQKAHIDQIVARHSIKTITYWTQLPPDLSSEIDLAIVGAGTSTLDIALKNVPMIVLGKLKWLSYFIGKYVLRIQLKRVALPNIIAGQDIVPEYLQCLSPSKISKDIDTLLLSDFRESLAKKYTALQSELKVESPPLLTLTESILRLMSESNSNSQTE